VSKPTLHFLAGELAAGNTTSRALVENSLARIADVAGEGHLAFINVDAAGARAGADYQDALRKAGRAPSPFAGIPFSVKDLFDLAGEVTTAGSKVLKNAAPATRDAVAIANLKAAGLVVLGRTNMTEFAYSGVGLNPHYGTPRSIFERNVGRIPGGSSSGAAVAVAGGMCALSIGTDTGGSCRIPAAYNGIVGFKPSVGRVSTVGAFPLSKSFDSVGPLALSVFCCAAADGLMAGDWAGIIPTGPSRPLRLGVLRNYVMADLSPEVAEDFTRSVAALRAGGVDIEDVYFEALDHVPSLLKRGGIVGAEAAIVHSTRLGLHKAHYDPLVASRIGLACEATVVDYFNILQQRANMISAFELLAQDYDALLLPTVANIAPKIADLALDQDYTRLNGLALRNTYIGNFLNACAIALPMHLAGHAPTSLMLMAQHGADQRLFAVAQAVFNQLTH
jgi:aspartyl-tRNA(Asn)/glutamyl-tRNA(Gln) amidotransferase subunit A